VAYQSAAAGTCARAPAVLAPYSPELQPAEHLWLLANTALVNQHCATIDELEDAQLARCATLQQQPAHIRSRWLGKQDCSYLPAFRTARDRFPSISSSRHGVVVRTTSDLPSGMSLIVAVSMQRHHVAQPVVTA
jgi:hypothetical protein